MVRFLFTGLLVIHALVHLAGFIDAFHLKAVPLTKMTISRPMGVLWLLSALLFLGAAAFFLLGYTTWWLYTLAGLICSVFLIFRYWEVARYGIAVNAVVLVLSVIGFIVWLLTRHP